MEADDERDKEQERRNFDLKIASRKAGELETKILQLESPKTTDLGYKLETYRKILDRISGSGLQTVSLKNSSRESSD